MKRILVLWFLTLLPSLAGGLVSFTSLAQEYGRPVSDVYGEVNPILKEMSVETKFRSNGLNIIVVHGTPSGTVLSIAISRDSPFSSMEIPDILKPLSDFEEWKSKDDSTWVLPHGKVTAQWDGEGKIFVEMDSAAGSKSHDPAPGGPAGHY